METRIHGELAAFTNRRARWPNFQEFQRAGRSQLYVQLMQRGGPARWARILGISYRVRGNWTDERIRAELKRFLSGETVWPNAREFEQAGHRELRRAVQAAGGPERWAAEIGVELPPQRHEQEHWTYAHMRDQVGLLAKDRSDWPVFREFEAAGKRRLYEAIIRTESRKPIAADLGLRLPTGRHVRGVWTDPAIKAALDEFLVGRTVWPTRREFQTAGLEAMLRRLARDGTRDQWAKRYGLEPPTPGDGRWARPV
jgi:hypothetical protein